MLTWEAKHVECDKLADGHLIANDKSRPDEQRKDRGGLIEQVDCLRRHIAERCGAKRGSDISRELLFPFSLHERLDRHRFDGLDARDALDEEGLVDRAVMKFLFQAGAEEGRYRNRQDGVKRQGGHHDPGEKRTVEEHHADKDRAEKEIEHKRDRRAGQKLANGFQFPDARHRVAHAARLKIGQRQSHQVTENAGAQLDIDPVARMRKKIGAQSRQGDVEEPDQGQAGDQNLKGRKSAMDEHLVDDGLKDQRRGQAEKLDHEGRGENLIQHAAVFCDRAPKPGQVEPARKIAQRSALC